MELGLPVSSTTRLEDLPEAQRKQAEEGYASACSEVGRLLVGESRYRDAWVYLRAAGDREPLQAALAAAKVDDENLDELVEVALHEGVDPARGFAWVLEHHGTCNAITTFEGMIGQHYPDVLRRPAEMLVERLHADVLENVQFHVKKEKGTVDQQATLAELVAEHEWIFEGDNYHIDTSHLSSSVRFSRLIEDERIVRQAWELTEYGRRLAQQFQYPGDPPFDDLYVSHGLLLAATLGDRVEEAIRFFRDKAVGADLKLDGTASIETYLILLSRVGREADALEEMARLVPAGMQLSPYAPRMLDLAQQGNAMPRHLEICRQRDDVLGFVAGLIESRD